MTAAMRAEVVRRLARRLAPGARCAVERPASRAGPAPPGMGRWVVIEYGGRAGYVLCVWSGMLITADEAEERNLEQIAVVPGRSVDAAALTARTLAEWLRLASPDHAADAAVGELRRAADAASRRALRRDGREDAEARAFARRCIEAGCWAGDDLAERAGPGPLRTESPSAQKCCSQPWLRRSGSKRWFRCGRPQAGYRGPPRRAVLTRCRKRWRASECVPHPSRETPAGALRISARRRWSGRSGNAR